MNKIFIGLIRFYQICLRPLLGPGSICRFTPTCSDYGIQALKKHGPLKGGWLTIKRLCKCGPWHPGGTDEVP